MYKYTLIVGKTAIKKSQPLKLTPLTSTISGCFLCDRQSLICHVNRGMTFSAYK